MMVATRKLTMYGLQGRIWGFLAIGGVVAFIIVLAGYSNSPRILDSKYLRANSLFEADIYNTLPVIGKSEIFTEDAVINKSIYAIVFDAGSTGSRIHVFQFEIKKPDKQLILVKETFQHVKPGLSSFADEPKQGAESLRSMLNKALQVVPSEIQKRIPMILKATAGLRLLSEIKAEKLLQEVKVLFEDYPFSVTNDSVNIMDGVDEGIFSWVTVNFLLGLFSKQNHTVVALDLGGGSTQVTFAPYLVNKLTGRQKKAIKHITLFDKSFRVYTHSYLGQGLMSARLNLLGGTESNKTVLSSPCLPLGYNGTWKHGGKKYFVSGKQIRDNPLNSCLHIAKKFVERSIQPLEELELRELYTFSYFYDRAADAGLIAFSDICPKSTFFDFLHRYSCSYCPQGMEDFDVGGIISVTDFHAAAKKVFQNPNLEQPFLGLDLVYIYSLLADGYKLSSYKKIHLKKKINGCETSWCLGAAFQLLSSTGLAR